MKKRILIAVIGLLVVTILGMVLEFGFVTADGEIAILTQQQIDGLTNIEQYVLSACSSNGQIYMYGDYLYTTYTCPYVEQNPEDELYYVYMGDYYVRQLLQPYLDNCGEGHQYSLEECEQQYWNDVVRQAMENIRGIAQTIRDYQTPDDVPYEWEGGNPF